MSIHDLALQQQSRNMNTSPLEALVADIIKSQLDAKKKSDEENKKQFKMPKFTPLQMFGVSPFVAWGGMMLFHKMWDVLLITYGIPH